MRGGRGADAWVTSAVFTLSFLAFYLLSLPAPTLFAAMLAGATCGVRIGKVVVVPRLLRDVGMATVGVAAGAAINREVLEVVAERPWTVLAGVLSTLILSLMLGQLLRISPGISGRTAAFASVAGGASGVSLLAREFDADDGVVLVIQYLRVLIVLVSVPLVSPFLVSTGGGEAVVVPSDDGAWAPAGFAFFLSAVVVGLLLARVVKFSASEILLPLIVASLTSVSGIFGSPSVPPVLEAAGYAVLGLAVGFGFTRDRLRSVARHMPLAVLQICVTLAACAVAGVVFAREIGVSDLDGYLATSPGGLAAVLAVGVDSGGQIGLIMTMQFVRVFLALTLASLIGAIIRRRDLDA